MHSECQSAERPPDHIVRAATAKDHQLLATLDLIASEEPLGRSFWLDLLEGIDTPVEEFLKAVFDANASAWGQTEDFLLIECRGQVAAGCAVFKPTRDASIGPLNLDRLGEVSRQLGWSAEAKQRFETAYREVWTGDLDFLKPQADAIIETVAVLPEFRGHGFGNALMEAAKSKASALGAGSLGVMVIHGNNAAQCLYDQHFERYTTYHPEYFNGEFPGITKYRTAVNTKESNDG
ncbi:MAG: GNAT family N-acetyltransferase [Planctomycetota bacterium]